MSASVHPKEETQSRTRLSGRLRLNLSKLDQALRVADVIDRRAEAISSRPKPPNGNGLDHAEEEGDSIADRKDHDE